MQIHISRNIIEKKDPARKLFYLSSLIERIILTIIYTVFHIMWFYINKNMNLHKLRSI